MNARPRLLRSRLAVAAVTAPLALALIACGDSDDNDDVDTDDLVTSTAPAPEVATSTAPSPDDDSTSTPPPAPAGPDVLLTAAATGLGAVDGATVFSVDRQDSGDWEVSLVTADGTERDVTVSADGATVTGGPVEDTDDADDAARDRDERLRLLEVPVDVAAAIEAAGGAGELTGADLDEDNGAATWEVQYGEDTADELTVVVDATTGEVLSTERDD